MAQTKKPLVFRDRDTKEKIPFYVKAEDVELPDGTDIETKVGEIEEALEGAADGTVKSVTLNGTKGEPDAEGDVALTLSVPEVDDELDAESGNAIANSAVAAAIAHLRTAIESVLGEGSTDAIENFQEVLDFLENVNDEDTLVGLLTTLQTAISGKVDKTDIANALDVTASGKVLDARQGKALNDLIAALQSGKSDKSATVSGLSYDTSSHKLKQTVNGTASDVMTVDTAPTANSDNPVTSGGVSTALATLLANISIGDDGYWYIGQTSTGVKAQGPKGNSVVEGDTFDIVNNLTDGGEGDALSAEMGKTLKAMIDRISAFTGYAVAASVSELPATGDATTGYIVGTHIYAYVETGGDTAGGKYQDLGDVAGAGTYVTTNGDGTFTIHVGSDTYTVNLNHTHENMAKLVVCEESDLPSTLDPATIYAQVDDANTPTEIQSLWIAGLEFVGGGGVPDDEPRLSSPRSGATIDFEGQSSVTLFVKGKNLTSALSIAVTGDFTVTLNGSTVSSIAASDANNGVTLTLTQGSTFLGGTIAISSTEVDTRTCSVDDSEGLMPLNGIKLTGTQWGQTDFIPTANTDIQMKMKLTANAITGQTGQGFSNFLTCYTLQGTNKQYALAVSWPDNTPTTCRFAPIVSASSAVWIDLPMTEAVLDNSILTFTHAGAFRFIPGGSGTGYSDTLAAVVAQVNPLTLGLYHTSGGVDQIFSKYDLTVYELKITDNGTLVRNYVPMRRAGVPGLYDTITGHFMSSKTSTDFVEIS